ncbi:Uncharacterized conserved protein YndB, AHSA1/START domain [Sphingomonas laterariae]|uniref:Uncharacterized conserved protein YndB, AHSA1/START domain n=1 Tax=Edaphosphingomonas laterariae TaxID=861865 RepID=A0A239C4K9_9SPHN|nr:SRPBCC family protein [Sphingomonas laterariae]SNS15195.1 Uncharacterized conserved protein YndB, AHSA1/START domain [Sphingomonas laterariae]
MSFPKILIAGVALAMAAPAAAEVVAATPAGFKLARSVTVKATPAEAYAALGRIGQWWNGEHSYSGNAANMRLDPRAGGCFCEALPGGGSIEHGRVIYAEPGKLLRFTGGLGPLQADAITGTLTWSIEAKSGATQITQSYVAGGYTPGGLESLAPIVDQVLGEQLDRLKAYLDK